MIFKKALKIIILNECIETFFNKFIRIFSNVKVDYNGMSEAEFGKEVEKKYDEITSKIHNHDLNDDKELFALYAKRDAIMDCYAIYQTGIGVNRDFLDDY